MARQEEKNPSASPGAVQSSQEAQISQACRRVLTGAVCRGTGGGICMEVTTHGRPGPPPSDGERDSRSTRACRQTTTPVYICYMLQLDRQASKYMLQTKRELHINVWMHAVSSCWAHACHKDTHTHACREQLTESICSALCLLPLCPFTHME